ncbi:MAG: hypothetical protein ABT15_33445 [Pseudonocardia sp. SCN 73-27]|nr:MAG: hypothetical protein ABS80_07100 [Pseudonocardia sp. SCN 72-51]ODU98169.1 MAG: hypothetical protein ABT15_33445 [Pseudonocardia sp. SCN 73-27]
MTDEERFGVDVHELAGAGYNAHVDHPEVTAAAVAEHIASWLIARACAQPVTHDGRCVGRTTVTRCR